MLNFIRRAMLLACCAALALVSPRLSLPRAEAAPPPADFEDALVTSIAAPTALAHTPDGRLLITTQGGQVRVFQNGALLSAPALNINPKLCTNSERGLLGIAVDPEFAANNYIYLYYTFNRAGQCPLGAPTNLNNPVNRVARFTLGSNNAIDPTSELVLVDNIISPNGNHNGGDLNFGKDGLLYISVGDGGADYAGDSGGAGANDAARDRHVLLGKILRITRDGAVPQDNPYRGANSGRCNITGSTTPGNWCQEIFATGLRNPFRFAFDPNSQTTRFLINDVGQNVWEEIDEGKAGADYGWNIREGFCPNNSTSGCSTAQTITVNNQVLTNPVFAYQHTGDCSAAGVRGNSITGGAFVPTGVWSAEYDGSYLFGEYVCGKIFRLKPQAGGGYQASEFVTGLGSSSAVHLRFGPSGDTQALYYTTYQGGGQIRRIRYTGAANRSPTARATASPTAGTAPLDVTFDGSTSTDPDNDPLAYTWNFGDGTTGTGAVVTHRYMQVGTFNTTLTVSDGRGGASSATVRIDAGNTAPQPVIISPTASQLFRVGETITLQGTAIDEQEGTLPASRLTWEVTLHHNNDHTHPYLAPVAGNNITFTAPAPEDLAAATGSFLEIRLTATDSQGLGTTIVQNFQPRKVPVTFATQPAGLRLTINNTQITAPQTLTSWDSYTLSVNAPDQTDASGAAQTFLAWSDGGARQHDTVTPASAATYTATYTAAASSTLPAPWATADIGAVGQAGSASFANSKWTLKGSGTDIWNNADAFRYAYQPLSGDGEITARVLSVTNTDAWAKAGVMIRASLAADAPHAMVVVTPANGVAFQRRASAGASSDHTAGARAAAPRWVRLVRTGSVLTGYESADGATWTQIGSATINLPADAYVGLALTAHNNSALATAEFDNVAVSTGGLVGAYYDNIDFSNLVTTRRDAVVNFDWGSTTPAGTALTNPDTFAVRWTGRVRAPVSGAYTFTTTSDDGVRLWIDDQLVIDNFTVHGATDDSATIQLVAGSTYAIRMEFFENYGSAVARLSWSYPGRSRQIIPAQALIPSYETPVSDLQWTFAASGWGPVERDRSNGENAAGDGRTLTLNGVPHVKGLGVHSDSDVRFDLNNAYSRFVADVGIDDEVGANGSIVFQVWADDVLLFDSGVMTGSSLTKRVDVLIANRSRLRLVVADNGDGSYDHADWADARLIR